MTSANGRDCAGFSVTRNFRVSGSNRQSETSGLRIGRLPIADLSLRPASSVTSVMVAPAGTSKTSSLNSPWAGRMET